MQTIEDTYEAMENMGYPFVYRCYSANVSGPCSCLGKSCASFKAIPPDEVELSEAIVKISGEFPIVTQGKASDGGIYIFTAGVGEGDSHRSVHGRSSMAMALGDLWCLIMRKPIDRSARSSESKSMLSQEDGECIVCGGEGPHVCIPRVIDNLRCDVEFAKMVRGIVEESIGEVIEQGLDDSSKFYAAVKDAVGYILKDKKDQL